jgi:tRNA pseudouridine13 synthase
MTQQKIPQIRTTPEDFEVEELPLFPLSGEGHHTYLWIEKCLLNTDDVLRALCSTLDSAPQEVGYAGRKDRRAKTRQWFSIPTASASKLANFKLPGAKILTTKKHRERLRLGQLWGNRFRLVVRDVDESSGRKVEGQLLRLVERGLPNRFGRQRFGRDGQNAVRGARLLQHDRLQGDRRGASLMISAVQSAVFNRVLERRPVPIWELLPGDLVRVEGTGELLSVNDPPSFAERLADFKVSPTGPIFGEKMRRPGGAVAVLEAAAMVEFGLPAKDSVKVPRGLRLFGDRRPLRVCPQKTRVTWKKDRTLLLEFELPAGSYATVLLEELFPDGVEEVG